MIDSGSLAKGGSRHDPTQDMGGACGERDQGFVRRIWGCKLPVRLCCKCLAVVRPQRADQ